MSGIGVNLRVTGHCNQGGRKYMEDMFSVAYQQTVDLKDLEYAFFGIFDGHGGPEAATYAKEHLLDSIVNQKAFWSDRDEDVLRAIRDGYISTHYAMWKDVEKWPVNSSGLLSTSGTTATVAFIMKSKIYIGHVGDSGIVLGFQEENERTWQAQLLTRDHKPESFSEKRRIYLSGGKVICKAGVPRVVWNRPKLGHKGPVRRSTPIDEIPFLAVSRSLGDFWSYNSEYDKFVVSPEPDVSVFPVDPRKHRCLIFGTDGLWNVMSPSYAVQTVQWTEVQNEKHVLLDSPNQNQNQYHPEWMNPSKNLVDEAIDLWAYKKLRADNTSVVTLMLDPPGPPRAQVLMSQLKQKYSMSEKTECSVRCGSESSSPKINSCPLARAVSSDSDSVDKSVPNVPPSGSVALFTHYGSNQAPSYLSLNKSYQSKLQDHLASLKDDADLNRSIVDSERSPESCEKLANSSCSKSVCTSNQMYEAKRPLDLVQINEVSSSDTTSPTIKTLDAFENSLLSSKFKRKFNQSSNASHSFSNIIKKKRLNESILEDEKTGSNSDVENEREHWKPATAPSSINVKRRRMSLEKKSRTSLGVISPLPSTGKMNVVKKRRSIQTTTRTLRSETPVKTLRSRNVDLSSINKQGLYLPPAPKCPKNLELSLKASSLQKASVFSQTVENVHSVGSNIFKRSSTFSSTHNCLPSKYSKPSNAVASAKRLPKYSSSHCRSMKTRSHMNRRIIK